MKRDSDAFGKAIALFTGSSFFGTLTQLAKGKLAALALGTAGVGILNQLTAMWGLFNSGAGLGLFSGLIRHITEHANEDDQDAVRRQFASVTLFAGVIAILAASGGVLASARISNLLFVDNGANANLVALILLSVPLSVLGQCYRSLLIGLRVVGPQVKVRLAADAASVVAFAVLVFPFGIAGGVLGFMSVHLFFLAFGLFAVWRVAGRKVALPSFRDWRWAEVSRNLSFGASGILIVLANVGATVAVSRWIIEHYGAESNGLYSTAWKVSSVYMAAVFNIAGSYYLPALISAKDDSSMSTEMNRVIATYMYILTPLILGLLGGGSILMHVMFTAEFAPAAMLLLLFLPGDLCRVTADAIGVSLVARRKLSLYVAVYVVIAAIYAATAWFLLDRFGPLGAAGAYLCAQVVALGLLYCVARVLFGFRFDKIALWAMARGGVAVIAVSTAGFILGSGWKLIAFALIALAAWGAASLLDARFRGVTMRYVRIPLRWLEGRRP